MCLRLLHADIAGVLGVGPAVGLGVLIRPSRAVKAVLRALHRRDGSRQGLTVAVPGKNEGKCIRRVLILLGRINHFECFRGGKQGGGLLVADANHHGHVLGVGGGVGFAPIVSVEPVLRALHLGDGDGTVALVAGDGVVQRRRIGICQLAKGHRAGASLRAGVVVFVALQPGGEGVDAFRHDAVKDIAVLPAAAVHLVLRAADGGHGADELARVRAADSVTAGDTSGGSLVRLGDGLGETDGALRQRVVAVIQRHGDGGVLVRARVGVVKLRRGGVVVAQGQALAVGHTVKAHALHRGRLGAVVGLGREGSAGDGQRGGGDGVFGLAACRAGVV